MSSFDTFLLHELLVLRQKKVENCHKNWHLIRGIHKQKLSHFGLKKMKLKSMYHIRVLGGGRPAGREKGFISTVVLEKRPSAAKKGGGQGGVKKRNCAYFFWLN